MFGDTVGVGAQYDAHKAPRARIVRRPYGTWQGLFAKGLRPMATYKRAAPDISEDGQTVPDVGLIRRVCPSSPITITSNGAIGQ